MRASVHGYTSAWKHTGTTGRLASTAARLPPAESPPTARSGAQPSSAACSWAQAAAARASSTAAGYGCSGARR